MATELSPQSPGRRVFMIVLVYCIVSLFNCMICLSCSPAVRDIRGSFHKYVTKRRYSVSFQNIKKIRNMCFIGNLVLSTSCEFCYDDITATLFINIKYGDVVTIKSIP